MSNQDQSSNYIISLGGSLIVPNKIDVAFLKKFRKLVLAEGKNGKKFLILAGGGKTCRIYQKAARDVASVSDGALDWIGIEACALNAELLRAIFFPFSPPRPLKGGEGLKVRGSIKIVSGGLKPGASSDSTSIYYAKMLGFKTILNLTNVAGIYDRDPNKFRNAKQIPRMTWKEFRARFGSSRKPGQHKPFDPSAARLAERLGIKVVVMNGRDISNLQRYFRNKIFKGTIIA